MGKVKAPAGLTSSPLDHPALLWLTTIAKLIFRNKSVYWSDTQVGSLIDPIPNPKRYLVVVVRGLTVSADMGEPGMSIRNPPKARPQA